MYMKNIKTKSYILWLFTLVTLWVTYAYNSISDSLTYLRWAWDTWHIGYIITEMFNSWWVNDWKIKTQYLELPAWLTVQNATTSVTWIVMLEANTGATASTTKAATSNIVYQVWNSLMSLKTDKSTTITAWNWLSGWGDLSSNRTLSINFNTACNGTNQKLMWNNTSKSFECGTDNNTTYSNATTSVNGLMSSTDKTKLDGIATGANNYIHPANHPASIITQDASNRFVTDTEKANWNAKADINSPTFTGTPSMTNNPAAWDNTTKIATTARVKANTATAGWTYEISCANAGGSAVFCIRINTTTWATECKYNSSLVQSWYWCTNPW